MTTHYTNYIQYIHRVTKNTHNITIQRKSEDESATSVSHLAQTIININFNS